MGQSYRRTCLPAAFPVPAQPLAIASVLPLLALSRCCQAVGVPAVQGLARPQPLAAVAPSPRTQGDGVPPLPTGLIPVPASRSILGHPRTSHCLHRLQNGVRGVYRAWESRETTKLVGQVAWQSFLLSSVPPRRVLPHAPLGRSSPCPVGAVSAPWDA